MSCWNALSSYKWCTPIVNIGIKKWKCWIYPRNRMKFQIFAHVSWQQRNVEFGGRAVVIVLVQKSTIATLRCFVVRLWHFHRLCDYMIKCTTLLQNANLKSHASGSKAAFFGDMKCTRGHFWRGRWTFGNDVSTTNSDTNPMIWLSAANSNSPFFIHWRYAHARADEHVPIYFELYMSMSTGWYDTLTLIRVCFMSLPWCTALGPICPYLKFLHVILTSICR